MCDIICADMPITVGAIRKLRADKRKAEINTRVKRVLRLALSKFRTTKTAKNLVAVYAAADRAAKSGVIKKGKADRIKSRLASALRKK